MKVLIIALSGIGNLIMAFPMINEFKKKYPDSEVNFLVSPRGTKELLDGQDFVNNIFTLDSELILDLFLKNKSKKLISQLNGDNYDHTITIYPSQGIFSAILMKLINSKNRIQHKYNFKVFKDIGWFLTYSPKIKDNHSVFVNLDLLDDLSLTCNAEDLTYNYNLKNESVKFANEFFVENELKDKFVIGIHPGGKNDLIWKRWDIKNWQNQIELFEKNYSNKIKFLIFLGPDEKEYEIYFKDFKSAVIVKDVSLQNTISLISKCGYFIGNDSGLSHCASLFKIPQSVIFGGTSYVHTAPFSDKVNLILPKNYDVFYIPYYGFIKKPVNLLVNLKAETVFKSVCSHMNSLNLLK
ncbi:glycosyltransferase family 9 protein [Methanococcus maripaludis]|uniref:ADP-heptose:LPS heptosyltransferase n=2 Tax=Methanococcus maripaludis TaxID=39152 RepID=A0A7J9SB17_METMI|nr:glycosyltransferase family 9 protein [Methanococcus maripaludis]MBA2863644.1 ADP-heptose:LPS heptosyltransferase [Methanococcus maripaludis]MBB6496350.1 ADP-heptose:LPS heptosyltransferase [Methanococcus maripaludis]